MKLINCFLCFTMLFMFTACDKDNPVEPTIEPAPTFTVVNDEETMPIWVNGKEDSEYIILAVHGGPGSNVLDFRTYKEGTGFKQIENTFLVAYWQQRASGQSQGPDKTDYYNIDQYVEDADIVINELKIRHPGKKIVLFGHSWGGMLTSSYLKENNRKEKVVAWVNAAGVHNGISFTQATVDDINAEADKRIQQNENIEFWEDIKVQLQEDPENANALAYSVLDNIPEVVVKVKNADFTLTQRAVNSNIKLFSEILETDNTPFVGGFNLPILFLWGEYDFAVSETLRDEVISKVDAQYITNITFPASGHYMMFHEPDLFATSMINFIDGL